MDCVAVSAKSWRDALRSYDDAQVLRELRMAWESTYVWAINPKEGRSYHDWTDYRAATLREARKRGLDISVARLGI